MVWWGPISLPHRLLSDVSFQGYQVCILIHQFSLILKDVWAWVALFTKLLKPFWLLFSKEAWQCSHQTCLDFSFGQQWSSHTIWDYLVSIQHFTPHLLLKTFSGCLIQEAAVVNRDLHPWLKWHMTYIYICCTHIYIRSSEQSLHVRKFACQLHIAGVSLLSGGPSVSWCRTNNSSKAFQQATSLPCLL